MPMTLARLGCSTTDWVKTLTVLYLIFCVHGGQKFHCTLLFLGTVGYVVFGTAWEYSSVKISRVSTVGLKPPLCSM